MSPLSSLDSLSLSRPSLPSAPSRAGLPRRALALVSGAALFFLLGCSAPKSLLRPELKPEEQRVAVYFPGDSTCEPFIDLGFVQGIAGQEPLPNNKVTEAATLESALDFLRQATYARGGNAVLLLDRKQSSSQAVYVTTGTAIRCPLTDDSPVDP